MMWALYQLVFLEILKKYPQIAEYSIGVEMHCVFE